MGSVYSSGSDRLFALFSAPSSRRMSTWQSLCLVLGPLWAVEGWGKGLL